MATMKDIAKLAGVSTSTVSHVINNNRYVSDEIREKVQKVVHQLNYRPSALARSFKLQETKTIGMLVTATQNPFFAEMVAEVEHYCSQQNYSLILTNTEGNSERLKNNLQTLLQKQVDGLILMCSETKLAEIALPEITIPTVIMDWWPYPLNADKVLENSEYGGYLATKTLIDHNHKKIAIITGNLQKPLAQNRLQGYKKALKEAGIPLNLAWIIESHFDFEGGRVSAEKLLQQQEKPTAIFACNDSIALGVYQAIWAMGLHIPEDISIIGYDNIAISPYLTPPLTTIAQPKKALAEMAVQTLLENIKNNENQHRTFMLEPSLIIRESVRNLE